MIRISPRLSQPLAFLLIGGLTFLLGLGVTLLCHDVFEFSSSVAAGIGFASGFFFSFPMNRKTVFASPHVGRFAVHTQIVFYICLCVVNLFFTAAIVGFLTDILRMPISLSKVFSTGLIAVENFFVLKYIIFSVKPASKVQDETRRT